MESKIYKDISKYDKKAAGLSFRQMGAMAGILIVSLLIFTLCKNVFFIFDRGTIMKYCVIVSFPIGLYGFFEYEGDNFETLVKNFIRYFFRIRFFFK